jgi:hypothetical protein
MAANVKGMKREQRYYFGVCMQGNDDVMYAARPVLITVITVQVCDATMMIRGLMPG